MTPEQIQQKSKEKIRQLQALMDSLKIRAEAKDMIVEGGFIEKKVIFIDEETYQEVKPKTNAEQTV